MKTILLLFLQSKAIEINNKATMSSFILINFDKRYQNSIFDDSKMGLINFIGILVSKNCPVPVLQLIESKVKSIGELHRYRQ